MADAFSSTGNTRFGLGDRWRMGGFQGVGHDAAVS